MKRITPLAVRWGTALALLTTLSNRTPFSATAAEVQSLQALIDAAPAGGTVTVPPGTWDQPLTLARPITLRAESPGGGTISVRSDQPAIRITSREPVVIEGLTIRWERATSDRLTEPAAALVLRDATATIRRCRFEAPGGNTRCPAGIHAGGLTELTLTDCEVRGFEYAVSFWDGAKGTVADCVIAKPGHCGITAGNDSEVEVARCVVAGSLFHGLRCTGGVLRAHDNLVIKNKNRGFYLGNRSARGEIRNNVLIGNATGISAFAQTEVEVANNVILDSEFAGLDARDTCRLRVTGNVIAANARGIAVFKQSGTNRNQLDGNLLWDNWTETEGVEPAPVATRAEPKFRDRPAGDFTLVTAPDAKPGPGLTDGKRIAALWARWPSIEATIQ